MKVLLVEDDTQLANALAGALRAEHCVVDVASNGVDAGHLGSTGTYDVVVLDLGLPDRPGHAVLADWRAAGVSLPVLILTARDDWTSKVEGFKAGADDYLTKPVRAEELVMRLRALVRRATGHAATSLVCGPLVYHVQLGTFELDGLPLRLTALEWRVLACLMLRPGAVVSRSELTERVYEGDMDPDSNSLEVIVGRLRRKVGAELIRTVRGLGYQLCDASTDAG